MAGKSRFSASDRFEYLQGLVTEFQDTDSEGMSLFADALHLYIFMLEAVCSCYFPLLDRV